MSFLRLRGRTSGARSKRTDSAVKPSRVDKLLSTKIIDIEYYRAVTGFAFRDERAVARHFIRRGMARSLSPSPLLDIANVPPYIQNAWRAGRIIVVLDFLAAETSQDRALSFLFHAGRAPGALTDKVEHPGGALGLFLDHADEDTVLPVPASYPSPAPTLGAAREAIIGRIRATAEEMRLTGPRVQPDWDSAAEASWKLTYAAAAAPTGASPLVTVITPVRNRPELVRRAIESVQQQTLADWELVVVDDGSTDSTPDVVRDIMDADSRVRLIQSEHRGVGAARNAGLSSASGRYVAFLDSDNTWRPDFLHTAVAAMSEQSLEAAYAAARMVDPKSGKVSFRSYSGGLDALMVKNHVDLNTLIVAVDVARQVGGFDEALRRWVDHDFVIKVAKKTSLTLLPFISCDYDDDGAALDRITNTESEAWQFVALGNNWVDWDSLNENAGRRDRSTVSIVIPTYHDWQMTVRAVASVLADADLADRRVEVVVIDNGSVAEVGVKIVGHFLSEPRVRYRRLPRNLNFAIGCNVGFSDSTGATVVFLNNDTVVRQGWLDAMLPHLEDPDVRGVQPLLLYPDDTIQTAGTVFAGKDFLPTHLLVGHPPEDGQRLSARPFSAVTAAALAVRATEFAELRGFDPIFVNGMEDVDLCLRALQAFGGGFHVEPTARVTHFEGKSPGRGTMITSNRRHFIDRWRGRLPESQIDRYAELGLTVAHLASDGNAVPAAKPIVIHRTPDLGSGRPRLRWGLKLPANAGPRGDAWGDTHLAESLAKSLRRLGQDVGTYRHGAHSSPASHLDDVLLGIRGIDVITPQPGAFNILWVISHPEDVSPEELLGFDVVFAASKPWAREMSLRCGRPVQTMHQAVDTDHLLLHAATTPGAGHQLLFVGATHPDRHRQGVYDAASAGVDLVVHGPGWRDTPIAPYVASEYVPNHALTGLYRTNGLVLADHWPDMAAHGFIANRVFDAVAAGARVVSDDVQGIEATFSGAVRVYRSVDELRRLCSPEGRELFPSDEEMSAIANRVREEHSFDARAQILLEAATRGVVARSERRSNGVRRTSSALTHVEH